MYDALGRASVVLLHMLGALLFSGPQASAWAADDTTDLKPGLQPVTLQLKWSHQFQSAGFYAALQQGYYAAAGLNVTLLPGGPGIDAVSRVLDGTAQFGVGTSSLLVERARGRPVVIVAPIFQQSPYILLTRDGPDTNSLYWLRGGTVMMSSSTTEILAFLHRQGVATTDIQRAPTTGDIRVLERDSGVDALAGYSTADPYDLAQAGIAFRRWDPRDAGLDFYGDTLFTSEQLAADNPMLVRAVREATLRGWQYAINNPGPLIDLILAHYSPNADRNRLIREAEETRHLVLSGGVPLGDINAQRWQRIAEAFHQAGLVQGRIQLQDLIFEYQPPARPYWLYFLLSAAITVALITLMVACHFYRYNQTLKHEVARRHELEQRLMHLAATDGLTGLLNRRIFFERAREEFSRARRQGIDSTLLVIDLDHFKHLNDDYGHAAGDAMLKALADTIKPLMRQEDVLGRYGGEEFCVLLMHTNREEATPIAERLRDIMEQLRVPYEGHTLSITISIGAVEIRQGTLSMEAAFNLADRALYRSKHAGRNRVTWHEPDAPPALPREASHRAHHPDHRANSAPTHAPH
jgi:diguanylate cyclase (GGDEF)-like protein